MPPAHRAANKWPSHRALQPKGVLHGSMPLHSASPELLSLPGAPRMECSVSSKRCHMGLCNPSNSQSSTEGASCKNGGVRKKREKQRSQGDRKKEGWRLVGTLTCSQGLFTTVSYHSVLGVHSATAVTNVKTVSIRVLLC